MNKKLKLFLLYLALVIASIKMMTHYVVTKEKSLLQNEGDNNSGKITHTFKPKEGKDVFP